MRNSSSSSGENSYPVLIKKAMAKMPMSLNTKKSIDEYYTTAMKKINLKMKAVEKAKKMAAAAEKAKEKAVEKARKAAKSKAVKGSKTAKKPRAKKLVGGMTVTDEDETYILDEFQKADEEIKSNTYDDDSNDFINSITNIINKLKKYSTIRNIETAFTNFKSNKTRYNAMEIMKLISSELINLNVI
jgi:hypothetical protein